MEKVVRWQEGEEGRRKKGKGSVGKEKARIG